MIIGIHQPNFLPWIGFFYKMIKCDKFVLLDSVQYIKNNFINRNRIKTSQGESWLTVPVRIKGKFGQRIDEVVIDNTVNWRKKHIGSFESNYKKSKFFEQIYNEIKSIYYECDYDNMCELNIRLLEWALSVLKIDNKFIRSSAMEVDGKSTTLLINIIKKMDGNVYLSGFGGSWYQEENLFKESEISLEYYQFKHPTYSQPWGNFIPNMSIIDLLFNHGPESLKIIMSSGPEENK